MLAAGRGRIVNISSIAGKVAEANRTAYCAAKWGLQGFSLALRHELEGTGVRVHVLNPAAVATGWWDTTGDPQPASVLERMMTPDDVARALTWMLTQPDHVQIDEVILRNAASPWLS
jgi:short-subunit dehydrogenase